MPSIIKNKEGAESLELPVFGLIEPERVLAQETFMAEERLRLEDFNLGVNDGPAAGQTMPQFHFHVIPRRRGDVAVPRGGIRWLLPDKARYW